MALYNEDDVHHKNALAVAKNISSESYGQPITSDDVFDEVVSVALRKFGKNKAQVLARQVMNSVLLVHGTKHTFRSACTIFDDDLPFSFTDCTSQAIMKMANVKYIATFDKLFFKTSYEVIC